MPTTASPAPAATLGHRPEIRASVHCAFGAHFPDTHGLNPQIWASGLAQYASLALLPILQRHPTARHVELHHPEGLRPGRMTWYHGPASYAARPHLDRRRDIADAVRVLSGAQREVHLYVGGAGRDPTDGEWMESWHPWADAGVRRVIIDGSGSVAVRTHRNVEPWIRFAPVCGLHLTAEGPPAPGSIGDRHGWHGYATQRLAHNILTKPHLAFRRDLFITMCREGRVTVLIPSAEPETMRAAVARWHALGAHVTVPITRLDRVLGDTPAPSSGAEGQDR